MPKHLEKTHSLAIRWFHWVNFPLLALMIYSGMLIYWANDVYSLSLGPVVIFKFFPEGFYKALQIPFRLAEGLAWHFACMWFFAINGVLYVLYTLTSGEWRQLVPERGSFRDALQVIRYDLGLSRTRPPEGKYNAAQRIAYTGIILCGLASILTGLAIYWPVQLAWLCALLGGYKFARILHFMLTLGYLGFFLIHLIQVMRAGWDRFQAMVTGYRLVNVSEAESEQEAMPGGRQ